MSEDLDLRIFDKITDRRVIPIIGEITPKLCEAVTLRLTECQIESTEPVTLLISSGGGKVFSALGVCDFMEHVLTMPIHGVVFGTCNSAASYILLHCQKRSATPYTQFLLHSPSMTPNILFGDDVHEKILQIEREGLAMQQQVVEMYQKRLNLTADEVKKLLKRGDREFDEYLEANEALKIGLITEIVSGKVGIFPNIS